MYFWPQHLRGLSTVQGRDSPAFFSCLLLCILFSFQAGASEPVIADDSDLYVVKEYPDGTRVKARWATLGHTLDNGEVHGGAPVIREMRPDEFASLPEEKKPMVISDPRPVMLLAATEPESTTEAPAKPSEPETVRASPSGRESIAGLREDPMEVRSRAIGKLSAPAMGPSIEYGQAFQDYAPQTLRFARTARQEDFKTRPRPMDEAQAKVEVSRELRAIVLWEKPGEVQPKGVRDQDGIVNRVSLLKDAEAERLLKPYLSQPVTFATIEEMRRKLAEFLVEKGRLLTVVILPEQEVAEDTIQFLILEGRLGKVRIEGNRYFRTENLRENLELREGEPVRMGTLLDDVAALNGNPFRQASVSLEPGEAAGQTDVVFEVKDRFPVRPFISYDNFGVQTLGYDRYSAGAGVMDVWSGLDQQFNFQYLTSGGFSELRAYSGSYMVALPWQHNLTVFGSYSAANPNASGLLSQSDFFWQSSLRYNIPLPILSLMETGDFRHQFYAGYDFKSADSSVFFSGAPLTPTVNGLVGVYNISQFVFGYTFSLTDEVGSTSFEASGFGSPGGMTSDNSDTSFQQIDGGAAANYLYGKFSLQRLVTLPADMALVLGFQTQQADANLMPSESFGIGGYDTVRGYDQRSANGDNAYLVNAEWRFPPVSFAQLLGEAEAIDQLVFLTFFDWGRVTQYSPDTVTSVNQTLMSVGPGLRYQIGPYLTVRFDWGFQLKQAPAGTTGGSGGRPGTSQAVISASLAY